MGIVTLNVLGSDSSISVGLRVLETNIRNQNDPKSVVQYFYQFRINGFQIVALLKLSFGLFIIKLKHSSQ